MGRSLEDRVALVTGASEKGTGHTVAVRFAAEGAKVAITGPNEDGLRETLALIEDVGSTGLVLPADFGDPTGPRTELVRRTEGELGPIDILVNNAVTATMQPIEAWTLEELDFMQQVNVWTPWLLMGEVLPGMRDRGRGWILNLTSSAGELPPGPPFGALFKTGYAGYGMSKAAINRLTIAGASETEDDPIAVNALSPQVTIATPMVMAHRVMETVLGHDDVDFTLEPVDTMAEAALALCTGDPFTLTGRISYSLQLLLELDRPVYDMRGEKLVPGMQPEDLPQRILGMREFMVEYGGADIFELNRPSTPVPAALRNAAG
jgi:NAD(P)-dependent dehydrogenase (short-subunit alcohol dehydrogenase family)